MGRSSWITAVVFGLIFAWPLSRSVSSPAWMAFTAVIARKDETDFSAVLPALTQPQREWLADAIALACDPGHPWHARLLAGPGAVT